MTNTEPQTLIEYEDYFFCNWNENPFYHDEDNPETDWLFTSHIMVFEPNSNTEMDDIHADIVERDGHAVLVFTYSIHEVHLGELIGADPIQAVNEEMRDRAWDEMEKYVRMRYPNSTQRDKMFISGRRA